MAEIKDIYLELKSYAAKHNIGVYELVKILQIQNKESVLVVDSRTMNAGLTECSGDKLVLTEKALQILGGTVAKVSTDFLPILNEKGSKFVKMLTAVLLKDIDIQAELKNLETYLKNPLLSPFFLLFLYLFPTSDKTKNRTWEKLFNAEWTNVTLRRVSSGTAKKFEQIAKTKDIGIFLAGAYQHVLQSYNKDSEKYYPKSLENFFKEWEHWYTNADLVLNKTTTGAIENKGNMTIV